MRNKYHRIVQGIRKYFKEYQFPRAVIGLSGGIDSTLCAKLVVDAIGADRVFGLILPDKGVTAITSVEHAKMAAEVAGIKYAIHPINNFLKPFKKLPWRENHNAIINTKSRIRANILFNYANTHNALVIGTSNKSELLLGYFTKYG
ncbi:NAD(+) synthase, partial [Nanoarchaeota archaeon]